MTTPLMIMPASSRREPPPLGAESGGMPRPSARERAQREGVSSLSDVDLLALLLATGASGQPVARVAQDLLNEVGGVERLERVGAYRLSEQRGIGLVKATRLLAAIELGRRVTLKSLCDDGTIFASFDAVAAWAQPRLAALDHEEVWLLCLDAKNALRSARRNALVADAVLGVEDDRDDVGLAKPQVDVVVLAVALEQLGIEHFGRVVVAVAGVLLDRREGFVECDTGNENGAGPVVDEAAGYLRCAVAGRRANFNFSIGEALLEFDGCSGPQEFRTGRSLGFGFWAELAEVAREGFDGLGFEVGGVGSGG